MGFADVVSEVYIYSFDVFGAFALFVVLRSGSIRVIVSTHRLSGQAVVTGVVSPPPGKCLAFYRG